MTPFWKKKDGHQGLAKLGRREAWQEVARRVGGTFVQGRRKGHDQVILEHGPWTIRLDTYTVHTGQVSITFTRARAFFLAGAELTLMVRKRGFLDTMLDNLGFGGFAPADRELARRFVVKGKPESRLRGLLTPGLAAAILAHRSLKLEVKKASRRRRKTMGPHACTAAVYATGVTCDPAQLEGMFTVVRETLEALERTGVACREAVASRV